MFNEMNIKKVKKIIVLSVLLVLLISTQSCINKRSIQNDHFKVKYADGKFSILDMNSNQTFLKDINIGKVKSQNSFETNDVSHKKWGNGSEIVITESETGNLNRISLFEGFPFVMLQREIENQSDDEMVVAKDTMFEGSVNLGSELSKLKSMSTAGLRPVTDTIGGYLYMTVANPENYNGIVCGWLTSERGSGIVFSAYDGTNVNMSARIDYGDLRIAAGEKVETETLLIGYADDMRLGLEKYADVLANQLEVNLPEMPNVYCTWYHAQASDEQKIKENSEFIAEELKPFGLNVVQIDDYWQNGFRNNGPHRDFSKVDPDGPYPKGMKTTSETIKEDGLVPGIWYMPFAGTWNDPVWADKQDLFYKQGKSEFNHYAKTVGALENEPTYSEGQVPFETSWGGTCLDLTNPKTIAYVKETAVRFSKNWGYEYFKIDGLFTGTGARLQYVNAEYKDDDLGLAERFNPSITPIEGYANGLDAIRNATGNEVFILGCSQTQNMRSFGPAMGRVDAMRVGPDNSAKAKHLIRGPQFCSRLYFLNKRVWYNDPDPVYVRSSFPEQMAKTAVSWTAITGSMHSSSYQYSELPKGRLDILKRSLPSHTLKSARPVDFLESDPARIWLLTDDRDSVRQDVIGLFNWDVKDSVKIDYQLKKIDLPKANKFIGFDYWENQFIPNITDSISVLLAPGACKVIAIKPAMNYPQVISTSRHLTQGVVDLKNENWDETNNELSGQSNVIAGDEYEIRIALPPNDSWSMDKLEVIGNVSEIYLKPSKNKYLLRVVIDSKESTGLNWKVYFKNK